MDKIRDILAPLEGVENARDKGNAKITQAEAAPYGLSEDGKKQLSNEVMGNVNAALKKYTDQGVSAIDAAIDALNTAEKNEQTRRFTDTGYVTRLNEKIDLLGRVHINDDTKNDLRELFSEFANDALAIYAINEALKTADAPTGIAMVILPENHNGEQQTKLENLKGSFIDAMQKAASGLEPTQVEMFKEYVRKQDDNFTRDPDEVWAEVYNGVSPAKANALKAADKGDVNPFNFKFVPAYAANRAAGAQDRKTLS